VPQIENGEALIIPTKSDIDVFVSQKMSNQIWNLEYIDLAHLLYIVAHDRLWSLAILRRNCWSYLYIFSNGTSGTALLIIDM
jgi:hypothetical protein